MEAYDGDGLNSTWEEAMVENEWIHGETKKGLQFAIGQRFWAQFMANTKRQNNLLV